MSLTLAGNADVVRVANNNTYTFRRPTFDDIANQIAVWGAEDRAALIKLCDECKVSPEFRFDALRTHDRKARMMSYGLLCACEFKRAQIVVKSACSLPSGVLPFSTEDILGIAAELWGLQIGEKESKKPEEPAGPLDQAGSGQSPAENATGS